MSINPNESSKTNIRYLYCIDCRSIFEFNIQSGNPRCEKCHEILKTHYEIILKKKRKQFRIEKELKSFDFEDIYEDCSDEMISILKNGDLEVLLNSSGV